MTKNESGVQRSMRFEVRERSVSKGAKASCKALILYLCWESFLSLKEGGKENEKIGILDDIAFWILFKGRFK